MEGRDEAGGHDDSAGTTGEPAVRVDLASLRAMEPREVLDVLSDGDPLDLAIRCRRARDELAYCISLERLHIAAMSSIALDRHDFDPDECPHDWVDGEVHDAIGQVLGEDLQADRESAPVTEPDDYRILGDLLEIDPRRARAAHVAFNGLDEGPRSALFALQVRGLSLAEHAAEAGISHDQAVRHVLEAAKAIARHGGGAAPGPAGLH